MKVLIEKEFKDLEQLLIRESSVSVRYNGGENETTYYLPYVFKKLKDGRFEMILTSKLDPHTKQYLIEDY